jgi:ferredoxin-NADP reductase
MSGHDKITAHLESRIEVSDGLAIFRFILEQDYSFTPGQYATLWLTHGGRTLARPYTIASSPSERRHLEFYINLVSQGRLTPSLWDAEVIKGLQSGDPGTHASISGKAKGRFVLNPEDPRDYVFIASGTGLAPFISMIRKMNEDLSAAPETFCPRRIVLIHGVSYPTHLGYREELEHMAAQSYRDPQRKLAVLYLPTISRPYIDSTWNGLKGRAETLFEAPASGIHPGANLEGIIKGMLALLVRPRNHAVYVCGHPGTIDNVVATMSVRGFRLDADLHHEKYYP